ncbi:MULTISPECIES: hypothetical protein [unclassified Gilliamella]|uniref:hypothetical protein n=1 Tax=unclassified Gilliamella TaxID=2685620 RepID=UPI00130A1F42|nr:MULTISPECIES: hypothetical protein [unclassified Gilliamella]MWP49206.1 hypothetical protein [Gilliamella sp. Lep-s35]MWP68085.1 hypothetical protein [Gilliamella sp. Lep-s5]MWP76305.1 hypothetical protein [Gilliamella sp. Lep-s21]
MALRIELSSYKPGIVKFLAQKWSGSSDIDILIQRNQDGYYLSAINQWSPEKSWHPLENMSVENEQLTGYVGEWLVDSLVIQESQLRFLIQVRDKQNQSYVDSGVVSIEDDVLPSIALSTQTAQPNVQQAEPIIEPEVQENSPLIEEPNLDAEPATLDEPIENNADPEPKAIETKEVVKPKSHLGLILAIVIALMMLIGLGIAVWYFLFFKNQSLQIPLVQTSGQCSVSNANTDDLTFIQQCLQTKPKSDEIIQVITEAKKAEKCNIAQRLYANQAQTDAKIAMLYAKEYDEKFYKANNCFKSDKETAIYWYETSLTKEPNNNFVKDRLTQLQN